MSGADSLPADGAASLTLSPPSVLVKGYLTYEHYHVALTHPDGTTDTLERDVVRVGGVVGILCLDPVRDRVVLIRQFRLAAHLATGRGQMIEIPAGRLEHGEAPEAAAHRECLEETGLSPSRLDFMFDVMPTPGVLDERSTLFLAMVDSTNLPERAGLAAELEMTEPFSLPTDEALRLLESGRCHNGYLVMALQWLALNRDRLAGRP